MALGLALALTLVAIPASAGTDRDIDLQQFNPAPGEADILGLESPGLPDLRVFHFFFALNYADKPFRLLSADGSNSTVASLIGHQTAANLGGSMVVLDGLEIGAVMPFTVNQTTGVAGSFDPALGGGLPSSGFGDLRLVPKYLVAERERWTFGASLPITFPTARGNAFLGHNGITAGLDALAERTIGEDGARATGNLGVVLRSTERYLNLDQSSAVTAAVGGEVPFVVANTRLQGIATLTGEAGLGGGNIANRPLELLLGVRWRSPYGIRLTAGAGPGLTYGGGTPDYRLFLVLDGAGPPREHPQPIAEATPEPTPAPLPTATPTPQPGTVTVDRAAHQLVTVDPVFFATDRDLILAESFPILERVAATVVANPWITKLRIEGHTDSQGGEHYNLDLSQRRAISVAHFLVEHGVDPDTLSPVGYGLSQPIATNDTAEGRQKNRRVVFTILETNDDLMGPYLPQALGPDGKKRTVMPWREQQGKPLMLEAVPVPVPSAKPETTPQPAASPEPASTPD